MWLLDKLLRRVVKQGELTILDHDGKQYRYGTSVADRPNVTVRFNDKGAAAHVVRYPQVGAAEVYMDGRMDFIAGDIRDLILLVHSNVPNGGGEEALQAKGLLRRLVDKTSARLDGINWKSKSRRNAEHTYNLTRRLYELFLDEDRQYTCAYFLNPDDSLEQAQLDKKAHLAAKLHLKPGMRVLDIGCGWGGLALYLHRHYGVEVLGVALAPDQIAFCQERAKAQGVADKVRFELKDYREVQGPFDRIVSVGLIEHLGQPHYPGFFEHTRKLLADDGVMVSHCCGRMGVPGRTDKFTRKYIFPGGYIPALSELVTEAEKNRLIVSDVEAVRYHYALTLKHWYERTVAAREEIVRLYDERFYRMWLFYLAGAESSFVHGGMVNWQLQYVKRRDAVPMVRDYLFEEELRLRSADVAPEWHLAQAAE
jgi:cyclopropane-fatty-acyl-phospholipid synthase